jgi:hypothetical protein
MISNRSVRTVIAVAVVGVAGYLTFFSIGDGHVLGSILSGYAVNQAHMPIYSPVTPPF